MRSHEQSPRRHCQWRPAAALCAVRRSDRGARGASGPLSGRDADRESGRYHACARSKCWPAPTCIACEDTRVTRKLTERYGIETPLTPYHEHNAAEARPKLLARLAEGQAVALVSDAGTPLISDPGYKLVRAAREAGHAVTALPGASAVLAGAVAGRPADRPVLLRRLSAAQAGRATKAHRRDSRPSRRRWCCSRADRASPQALADLAAGLGARSAAVCRELTKLHEEVRRDDLATLAAAIMPQDAETRGEIRHRDRAAAPKQKPTMPTSTRCCATRSRACR